MKSVFQKLILLIVINFYAVVLFANENPFQEGKEYQRLPEEVTKDELVQELAKNVNKRVQVIEFFSYGCHWCYSLDPILEKWRKDKKVDFQRIPVEFQPSWAPLTKAYYTQINLNAPQKIHSDLFEAVQTEKLPNTSTETLREFFVSRGVKEQDFNQSFESFEVARKQKWANAASKAFRITAIPAVVVQGQKGAFMTSVRMAGSEEDLLKVLDYLVKMQNEKLKKSAKK